MKYAGFWRRFGAYWLDMIIMLPVIYLSYWGFEQSRYFGVYYFLPGLIFGIWYHMYLVKRYGGTPGKLLLNIRIARLDGSPVGYKNAILRYIILFVLSTLMSIASILAHLSVTDEVYFSMQWMERTQHIMSVMPAWYRPLSIVMNVWVWSEFIVMLTNRKRRAIHDFMAGTVVLLKNKESDNLNRQGAVEAGISA